MRGPFLGPYFGKLPYVQCTVASTSAGWLRMFAFALENRVTEPMLQMRAVSAWTADLVWRSNPSIDSWKPKP